MFARLLIGTAACILSFHVQRRWYHRQLTLRCLRQSGPVRATGRATGEPETSTGGVRLPGPQLRSGMTSA